VDVTHYGEQIDLVLDQFGLEPALKEVAGPTGLVPRIEGARR